MTPCDTAALAWHAPGNFALRLHQSTRSRQRYGDSGTDTVVVHENTSWSLASSEPLVLVNLM